MTLVVVALEEDRCATIQILHDGSLTAKWKEKLLDIANGNSCLGQGIIMTKVPCAINVTAVYEYA